MQFLVKGAENIRVPAFSKMSPINVSPGTGHRNALAPYILVAPLSITAPEKP